MRTFTFFSAIAASASQTSPEFDVDCGKDMRWLLQVTKAGTDGDPKLTIEETIDGTTWTPIENPETFDTYFLLDTSPVGIKDSYFMGRKMRLKLEPNGTTTGTVSASMSVKTKSG